MTTLEKITIVVLLAMLSVLSAFGQSKKPANPALYLSPYMREMGLLYIERVDSGIDDCSAADRDVYSADPYIECLHRNKRAETALEDRIEMNLKTAADRQFYERGLKELALRGALVSHYGLSQYQDEALYRACHEVLRQSVKVGGYRKGQLDVCSWSYETLIDHEIDHCLGKPTSPDCLSPRAAH